jgi:hypothetical protein
VATEGKGEKGPDFSKIMDAAREAVKSGMTKVTSQILGMAVWLVGRKMLNGHISLRSHRLGGI